MILSGRVAVPDERLDYLNDVFKPPSKVEPTRTICLAGDFYNEFQVPAYLTVIDIAGLVKGASKVFALFTFPI